MSKIGKKPIICDGVDVVVKGQVVEYKTALIKGSYEVPDTFHIHFENNILRLEPSKKYTHKDKKFWGLHRALLVNSIMGAKKPFEVALSLVGLGYKAEQKGNVIVFALGYSNKINFEMPKDVSIRIEKNGQRVVLSSYDKSLVGLAAQRMRDLRSPEPYKGKGVRLENEVIIRKEGKKASKGK